MKFLPTQATLNKLKAVATILSLIAVPVLIAFIGSRIQSSISNESIKRDYVQMAVRILAEEPKSPDSSDLRKWAVDILAKNSPVPFTTVLEEQLKKGQPWIGATLKMFPGPEQNIPQSHLFEPPVSLLEPKDENLEENMKRSEVNVKRLKELQEWVIKQHQDHDIAWDKFISQLPKPKP
jgi:hypothetical protein